MEYRMFALPPFTAVISGADVNFDLSEQRKLGKFGKHFSAIQPPRDGDEKTRNSLYAQAMRYIADRKIFEPDERFGHYVMGHLITPAAVICTQGYTVMETLISVKLKRHGEAK